MYKVTLINGETETIIHSPHFNDLKVQSGQIKKDINKADGFTFSIMQNNKGYNLIRPLKTLVQVKNMQTNKVDFDGRVLMPTEDMSGSGVFGKSFLCEGALGFLNDSVQRHGEYHDITVRNFLQIIIDNHNTDIADDEIDKRILLGEVDVDSSTGTLYRYLGYETTLEAINDKLIDRLGGEIRIRNVDGVRYLDYMQEFGELKKTEIRLSKNLRSISREIDPTQIITRLIPLGESLESDDEDATDASQARLTIESVNDGKDYIDDDQAKSIFGIIAKSETWNDITQPGILKTRGHQFLEENNKVKEKYQIGALDLSIIGLDTDNFDIYNYYPVINPVMGINENLRIIGKTIDIIQPENNNLEVGDHFKTASEYQYKARKTEQNVVKLESTVERQSKVLSRIRNEVNTVETNLDDLQQVIANTDLEELPDAIAALEQSISDLNDALDGIPIYGLATHDEDGLMASSDKIKLDTLEVYEQATELTNGLMSAEDKQKLNKITVNEGVDLDDVLARLDKLENIEDPQDP